MDITTVTPDSNIIIQILRVNEGTDDNPKYMYGSSFMFMTDKENETIIDISTDIYDGSLSSVILLTVDAIVSIYQEVNSIVEVFDLDTMKCIKSFNMNDDYEMLSNSLKQEQAIPNNQRLN